MHLNLARKWRSKHFDELVDQELVIRLIKNSLYRALIFPVYLLSGMRGCGKTTVGRLFASALNCQQLAEFQKNPQVIKVPCNVCQSCTLMHAGQHPDFIEIDAASHTGVETIRQLIDTVSLFPVMGVKKIYLIDEAHMLSKAAFSALLKILEEPPINVVFMLATTDPHKILDTVRSRCFQLFFTPIATEQMVKHLAYICAQENINYQMEGLEIIAQESEGSLRDALNIVERVRLAFPTVDKASVTRALGFVPEEALLKLFITILRNNAQELIQLCSELKLETYDAYICWKKLVGVIRQTLLLTYDISQAEISYSALLKESVRGCSITCFIALLETCYAFEFSFSKTTTPFYMLEFLLLKLNSVHSSICKNGQRDSHADQPVTVSNSKTDTKPMSMSVGLNETKHKEIIASTDPLWQQFLDKTLALEDPLIISIFKQSRFVNYTSDTKTVSIAFAKNLTFFKEWLANSKHLWQPIMDLVYNDAVTCNMDFSDMATVIPQNGTLSVIKPIINTDKIQTAKSSNSYTTSKKQSFTYRENERMLTNFDMQKLPKAQKILHIFPGIITHVITS